MPHSMGKSIHCMETWSIVEYFCLILGVGWGCLAHLTIEDTCKQVFPVSLEIELEFFFSSIHRGKKIPSQYAAKCNKGKKE